MRGEAGSVTRLQSIEAMLNAPPHMESTPVLAYCTTLHYTVLYYTILCYTFNYAILCYTMLYYTILYLVKTKNTYYV